MPRFIFVKNYNGQENLVFAMWDDELMLQEDGYECVVLVEKANLGANAMNRVAAGAHLSTPWLFEPAKRSDNRADYCLDCSFLHQWKHHVLVFTLEWSEARPMGEQW